MNARIQTLLIVKLLFYFTLIIFKFKNKIVKTKYYFLFYFCCMIFYFKKLKFIKIINKNTIKINKSIIGIYH